MKIRMKIGMSGSWNGVPYPPLGHQMEVDDATGAALCAKGLATPVVQKDADVEKAVVSEKSEKRSGPTKESMKGE